MSRGRTYKGVKGGEITFPADYSETFEHFKAKHETSHVFAKLPEKKRLSEMKKAFAIGTNTENQAKANDIEVKN